MRREGIVRLALRAYPREVRASSEDELLGTALDLTAGSSRSLMLESATLVRGGLSARARMAWHATTRAQRAAVASFIALVVLGQSVTTVEQVSVIKALVQDAVALALMMALVNRKRWAWIMWLGLFGLSTFWLTLSVFGAFVFPRGPVGIAVLIYFVTGLVALLSPPMRRHIRKRPADQPHGSLAVRS